MPAAAVGLLGVTAMDTNVGAATTVTIVEPRTSPEIAFTVKIPGATPVHSPVEVSVPMAMF